MYPFDQSPPVAGLEEIMSLADWHDWAWEEVSMAWLGTCVGRGLGRRDGDEKQCVYVFVCVLCLCVDSCEKKVEERCVYS